MMHEGHPKESTLDGEGLLHAFLHLPLGQTR